VLQFDVNAFNTQAVNNANVNSPFGGVAHTGAVNFSIGAGVLNGVFMQTAVNGPFANANFAGFTLTNFAGQVVLNNGVVTGGSMTLTLNNADSYTCVLIPGSGAVSNYVGGGYKIEALTNAGFFNDSDVRQRQHLALVHQPGRERPLRLLPPVQLQPRPHWRRFLRYGHLCRRRAPASGCLGGPRNDRRGHGHAPDSPAVGYRSPSTLTPRAAPRPSFRFGPGFASPR
jgi:hypothetical protein